MAPVRSYVFIDLETTGLPAYESNRTKITELSMVAVKRQHILHTKAGDLPRVQHKLTLCFNPQKLIHPDSTDITGLSNDLLEHEAPFNIDAFTIIDTFLKQLEKPVCLIAHNGLNFDFPILKNHLLKLNLQFADDLMCADSYHGFYDILEHRKNGVNGSTIEAIDGNNMSENDLSVKQMSTNETPNESCVSMQAINENTPKRLKMTPSNIRLSKVRRRLPFGDGPRPKDSYKLVDVYSRVLNCSEIEAHRAENDCIMALKISVVLGETFVNWVDENQCEFGDVRPMMPGVRLGL